MIAPVAIMTYAQLACYEKYKLFSIVNKFPKMEKLFTILNSFLIFGKLFSRNVGLLPEMSSEAIEPIHLKFESRDE